MATNSNVPDSEPLSFRQLWQAPMFLLGLSTLVAFLLTRPLWNNPLSRARTRLDQARHLWERNDKLPTRVLELAQFYLDRAGSQAPRAAEAHLICGSCMVRIARMESGDRAMEMWRDGYQHLLQARDLGLPDEDLPRMRAALGEAGFYIGDDLNMVCQRLKRNLEAADDVQEACRILTLACLKKQPPDFEGALKANEALRQQPLLGETVLGPARLQGGEILMELHRPTEARKLLEKIARDAAPELLARARVLRARSLQEEWQWADAAVLWQETLDDRQQPPADPGEALYNLGLCQRRLDSRDEAIRTWREGVKRGRVETAIACSLGLGELLMATGDTTAVDALVWAVRDLRTAESWTNPIVDLKQVRDLFELGCLVFRQKKAYEKSLALAEVYDRIAAPGRASYQRGLVLQDWGRSLSGEAASERLKQSGLAFEQAAEATKDHAEQAERLWLSAAGHLEGGEAGRAVKVLERFLQLSGHTPERFGEAWFDLGTAHERLGHQADAEAAYRRSITYRGRFAYRARFRLGEMELARGNTDAAIDKFEMNIKQMRLDPDPESMEKSLFSLGHLLATQHRDYPAARLLLEEAVSAFPSSSLCVRGRLELGETYRQLAVIENQNVVHGGNLSPETRDHFVQQRRVYLTRAAEQFELLSQELKNETRAAVLTPNERIQVMFSMADCRFNLGEYAAALKLYDALADRYKGRLEHLSALGGTARCFAAQRDFTHFRARLDDIRLALKTVDPQTRREWEQWLSIAGKGQ
jgi:tetratricopeptide (TPR) repeat protein